MRLKPPKRVTAISQGTNPQTAQLVNVLASFSVASCRSNKYEMLVAQSQVRLVFHFPGFGSSRRSILQTIMRDVLIGLNHVANDMTALEAIVPRSDKTPSRQLR